MPRLKASSLVMLLDAAVIVFRKSYPHLIGLQK
jgi:hypothetical protein